MTNESLNIQYTIPTFIGNSNHSFQLETNKYD